MTPTTKPKPAPSKTNPDLQHIRAMAAPTATDEEFKTFMYLCNAYNLDPLKKEIYFIKYGGKSTIITSRDGYLKIANVNEHFDGLESDVVYQGDQLIKRDNGSLHITYGQEHLMFDKSKLTGAFCSVFRKDRQKATTVFVSIRDYYKKEAPIWQQYTNAMILKVAEAMALKRAFAISGLVTKEEIDDYKENAELDL
ncbi:phage recombination protein Bet [bacterium]|nr:MAG: phage recombination protein Bet [bacterium]